MQRLVYRQFDWLLLFLLCLVYTCAVHHFVVDIFIGSKLFSLCDWFIHFMFVN